jgi:urease accessory protein UreE
MLCDRVLGNVADDPPVGAIALSLTWRECRSRAVRKVLPDGRTVRILLPPGAVLRHGDVLQDEPGDLIYVDLLPIDVLIAQVEGVDLLRVTYALGNLHFPIQIEAGTIATPVDGPAMAVFSDLGIATTTARRRFHPLPLPNGLSFRASEDLTVSRT